MDDSPDSGEALPLLGEVYRLRGTGLFLLGPESPPLGLVLRDGQISALCPPPGPRAVPKKAVPLPSPGDSAKLKLDQVLAEVGLSKRKATVRKSAGPARSTKTPREVGELREQIVLALANGAATATFEETTEVLRDAIPTTAAIESLILDALRSIEDKDRVRDILGDVDQRLVATAALAKQKRTLTLTEGYLLSRVDGQSSIREILQLVPLQSDEAETTLAALLLTGRLNREAAAPSKRTGGPRAVPAASPAPRSSPEPIEEDEYEEEEEEEEAPTAPKISVDAGADEDAPLDDAEADEPEAAEGRAEDGETEKPAPAESPSEDRESEEPAPAESQAEDEEPEKAAAAEAPTQEVEANEPTPVESLPEDVAPETEAEAEELVPPEPVPRTPEQDAERQEILDLYESLAQLSHYEVLGVERRCSEADLKKAQVALVKRYHPDMRREPYLEDLHDVLEAIFIRIGEAWDVLSSTKSRAAYEQYLGRAPRDPRDPPPRPQGPNPDDTLRQAEVLLGTGRYWDAIQILETAMPQFDSQEHQNGGRILLARAYSRNPKWVHRAVETLQEVLAKDPKSANAYYELGLVYKNGGLATRAEAMFQKALDANPRHKQALAEFPANEEKPAQGGLFRRLFGGKS
jgi:tetratricopeptide (TPR) repeat protein